MTSADRQDGLFHESSDPVEEPELGQRLHDDEEAGEEDQGRPLHPREDVVHLQLVGQNLPEIKIFHLIGLVQYLIKSGYCKILVMSYYRPPPDTRRLRHVNFVA